MERGRAHEVEFNGMMKPMGSQRCHSSPSPGKPDTWPRTPDSQMRGKIEPEVGKSLK